jgi:hypothetical protein
VGHVGELAAASLLSGGFVDVDANFEEMIEFANLPP